MNEKRALILMVVVSAIAAGCAETIEPKSCTVSEQCEANEICQNGTCRRNPCLDGILSNGESDVDCGGVCSVKCEIGKACNRNEDCALNTCINNKCIDYAADCEKAVAGDIVITEVLNNAAVNKTFDGVDTQQTEFIEIVNLSHKKVDLGTLKVRCQRLDIENAKPTTFEMTSCLGPMDVAVLSNTDVPVPDGGLNLLSLIAPNQFANTGEYSCTIIQTSSGTEEVLHTVKVPAGEKAGLSAVLQDLKYMPSEVELLMHNLVSPLNHSPGYCSNGRLFKNNCDTMCHDGIKNEAETDTDCGGPDCGKCGEGKACLDDGDCLSGSCIDDICQPESCVKAGCPDGQACDHISGTCHSCEDRIQSGDESDIDCGGHVCNACELGSKCNKDSDCVSQSCSNGICLQKEITCSNGKKDSNESDVDCGGSCSPCENGHTCLTNSDCSTDFCDNGTCGNPKCTSDSDCKDGFCEASGVCTSCSDGIKNGDETDVDCGGQRCDACDSGKVCQANIDCLSYHCQDFVCEGDPLLPFKPDEIIINEVMGAPKSGAYFGTQPKTIQCEFVEIVSIADGKRQLTGWDLKYQKYNVSTDTLEDKPVSVPLSGVISPKSGVVANNCANLPLPENMKDITIGKNQFVNAQAYLLWLENEAGDKTEAVLRVGTNSSNQGQSQTRAEELMPASDLVFHQSVSPLSSSPGYCANGGLFTENCTTTCTNGKLDEDESDIDCGEKCGGCEIGKFCSTNKDCKSDNCDTVSGTCAKAKCKTDIECEGDAVCVEGDCISCSDGILNGDEADIDCGGSCPNACANGRQCTHDSDCKSYKCQSGYCNGTECSDPKAGDLVLTEFFNNVSPSASMSMYDTSSTQTQVEFVEFANLTNSPISLRDVTIKAERQDNTGTVTAKLEGCVPPHQAVVVSGSALNGLPDGVVNIIGIKESSAFVNTGYYKMSLLYGSTVLHALTESVKPGTQVSRVPEVWNDTHSATFINHSEVNSALKHSPGYCTNGELFVNSCTPHCENGIKDSDESDVDCGGSCNQCDANKACHSNADCLSDECKFNKCSGGAIPNANPSDLIINEVMGAPDTASVFETSSDKQCEFVEIVNLTNTKLRLDGLELIKYKSDSETIENATSVALTGMLPANEALIVSECETMTLPADAHHLKASLKLTNGASYILALRRGTVVGDLITRAGMTKNGISQTRYIDLDTSTDLVMHNTINDKKNSPGYCANGNRFNTLCK